MIKTLPATIQMIQRTRLGLTTGDTSRAGAMVAGSEPGLFVVKTVPQYRHVIDAAPGGTLYGAPQLGQVNGDASRVTTLAPCSARHVHRCQYAANDAIGVQALDFSFRFQKNTMSQNGQSDQLDVVGNDKRAPLDGGIGF